MLYFVGYTGSGVGREEELGRHRSREGKLECTLCGAECESVVHVLWECMAYSSSRASFTEKLQELLGDSDADFDLLSNVEKSSYVLGSEHWEKSFKSLLFIVKEYIVDIWEVRKQILYGDDACPSPSRGSGGVSLELISGGVASWTNVVSLMM